MSDKKRKLKMSEQASVMDTRILNEGGQRDDATSSAVDTSKSLQKLMLRMKGEVFAEDGSGVRYNKLSSSPLFAQYKDQAQALCKIDLTPLSEEEKMAFFINIYNALMIHGLATLESIPKSVLDVESFWANTAYNIGGLVYSLEEVEHGILRSNRHSPGLGRIPFEEGDPRLQFSMKKVDPRLHFALNCGAKSCPAIRVYTSANLDKALDGAAKNFCQGEVEIVEDKKRVVVSQLLEWYGSDFGENDVEAVRWSLPYLSEDKQNSLKRLLESNDKIDVVFREYDWNINAVED